MRMVGFRSHKDMWATDASRLEYPLGAKRYEFATMHFGSALGLAEAINVHLEIGSNRIWEHGLKLVDRLLAGLETLNIEVISPLGKRRSLICSLRLPENMEASKVAEELQ